MILMGWSQPKRGQTRLLSIYARQARDAALIGHRMVCLAHSDDADLALPPLLTVEAVWNDLPWP